MTWVDAITGTWNCNSFADNHDVERIASKIINKDHLGVIYTLVYTLPGIPSIYYGSEFGIEGKKEQGSDASLRPHLELNDYADAMTDNPLTALIAKLGLSIRCKKHCVMVNTKNFFLRTANMLLHAVMKMKT